jgi:hypothetical protein
MSKYDAARYENENVLWSFTVDVDNTASRHVKFVFLLIGVQVRQVPYVI